MTTKLPKDTQVCNHSLPVKVTIEGHILNELIPCGTNPLYRDNGFTCQIHSTTRAINPVSKSRTCAEVQAKKFGDPTRWRPRLNLDLINPRPRVNGRGHI